MKNLKLAIKEEQSYINDRLNNINTSLLDRLKQYGYETLNEYFKDKKDYEFSQVKFNFVEKPMPDGVSAIFEMINTNEPGILFVDWENTYVVCGDRGMEEFNQEYCEKHNITFFPLYTNGGTIVGSSGDFSLGIYCQKSIINNTNYILDKVAGILQNYTSAIVAVDGNDIVADGKKICGSANYTKNNMLMTIMHFSFSDWTDLISNICLTTKKSKPVVYIDFMRRDQFKEEVLKWLQKF